MSVKGVIRNIDNIFAGRKAKVYALCRKYAKLAIEDFRSKQSSNAYWDNQTGEARDSMFTNVVVEEDFVSWFMAHGVEYGPMLELGDNAQNEAIKPTIDLFKEAFYAEVRELYA